MTTTFLGFLMNRSSREEFVAPVVAEEALEARRELFKAYPESRYALLTVYTRAELEHVLQSVDRWPGLPSKVQPPLTQSAPVRVQTGGLPKLPQQVQAVVQPVETIEQNALPGWMQSLMQPQAPKTPIPPAKPLHQQMPAMPVQRTPQAAPPARQPDAITRMMAEQRPTQAPQSLIERLKMARGESVAVPVRREPVLELPAPAITRGAGGPSVIDILKGMRK